MFSDRLQNFDLILASSSPRRRQLMEEAGFRFRVVAIRFKETQPSHLRGKEIAEFLAAGKSASWDKPLAPGQVLITADTIVWCHDENLGKPADDAEAIRFLRKLSGCRHEVITGICLRDSKKEMILSVTTGVTFRELSDDEIEYYVSNYRPLDKAGAYGIQEWIGLRGITTIEGSYYNVVGMPVSELYTALLHFTGNEIGHETGYETASETGKESGHEPGSETGYEPGKETSSKTVKESGHEPAREIRHETGHKSGNATGNETRNKTRNKTRNI